MGSPPMTALKLTVEEVFVLPNGTYDYQRQDKIEGCMEGIATNATDIVSNWVAIKSYWPHVKYFTITDETSPVILSAYDVVTSTSHIDVLSWMLAAAVEVYFMTALIFLLAYIFFRIHSKSVRSRKRFRLRRGIVLKGKKETSWISYFIGIGISQLNSCDAIDGSRKKSSSFKVMHMTVLMFVFFVHFFFKSFIKTDLVTVHQATIIETYQQILDAHGMKVRWISYEPSYKNFMNAKHGSVKNKLWLKSQPDPKIMLEHNNVVDYAEQINRSQIVLLGNWVPVKIVHQSMCLIARMMESSAHFRPLIMRSTKDDLIPKASVYNDRLKHQILQVLELRMRRTSEAALLDHAHALMSPENEIGSRSDRRICAENKVREAPEPEVNPKTMTENKSLFLLTVACLLCAISAIAGEVFIIFWRKRRHTHN